MDEFEQMFSISRDNRHLFSKLTHRIKLVIEASLELLTRNCDELHFRRDELGVHAFQLLFQRRDFFSLLWLRLELTNSLYKGLLLYVRSISSELDGVSCSGLYHSAVAELLSQCLEYL